MSSRREQGKTEADLKGPLFKVAFGLGGVAKSGPVASDPDCANLSAPAVADRAKPGAKKGKASQGGGAPRTPAAPAGAAGAPERAPFPGGAGAKSDRSSDDNKPGKGPSGRAGEGRASSRADATTQGPSGRPGAKRRERRCRTHLHDGALRPVGLRDRPLPVAVLRRPAAPEAGGLPLQAPAHRRSEPGLRGRRADLGGQRGQGQDRGPRQGRRPLAGRDRARGAVRPDPLRHQGHPARDAAARGVLRRALARIARGADPARGLDAAPGPGRRVGPVRRDPADLRLPRPSRPTATGWRARPWPAATERART